MKCFEWQSHASDHLDGLLEPPEKEQADRHLETCKGCYEKFKHYQLILKSIASQPRSSLPVPIRKSPVSGTLPRLKQGKISRYRWEQVPWYLRTTIEALSIVAVILIGISAAPKIRALYERSMEKSLGEFDQSSTDLTSEEDPAHGSAPLIRGRTGDTSPGATVDATGSTDEFSGETEEDETEEEEESNLRVGNSEIWRFILKTDSPHEIRKKVVEILQDLGTPAQTPGLGGIEVPGGIQFDLLLPKTIVTSLKKHLQSTLPKPSEGTADSAMGEPFTWYKSKNRGKRTIPEGKTRVVIWLSQF